MSLVVVPGRGVIRWSAGGVRKTIPFPGGGQRASLHDLLDGILLAGSSWPIRLAGS